MKFKPETTTKKQIDLMDRETSPSTSTENGDNNNIVLLNSFVIANKRFRVFFHSGIITWEKEKDNQSQVRTTVPIGDVISIDYQSSNVVGQEKPTRFTINYAKRTYETVKRPRGKGNINKWRKYSITMRNSDFRITKQWVETIQNEINEQTYRPHRLLLFVNPFGGKCQALRIYEKFAKPIFQLAKIDVNVIISQRSNQIKDFVQTHSQSHYDGIICVGGDGTFSELFNGLVFKEIINLGLDPHKPAYIPKPSIPIGIIPAGSTNTIAYCLHGTSDIQTAVIHIVLGQTNGLDLSSVQSSNGGLIRMFASVMSYGYLGDVAADSEHYRWMGPKRYDYSGFKKFMLNRGYDGEISLELDQTTNANPINGPGCYEQCSRCSDSVSMSPLSSSMVTASSEKSVITAAGAAVNDSQSIDETISDVQCGNKLIRGKFFMISGANISCACARSPNGFSKYCHLGDGCFDLVVIRHSTFINNLKLLLSLSSKSGNISNLPFVEIYRAKEFTFRAAYHSTSSNDNMDLNSSTQPIRSSSSTASMGPFPFSYWNCDGETIHDPDITVKSHCQLINVFRRGICSTEEENTEHSIICGLC